MPDEERIYASNGTYLLRLCEVDLHDVMRTAAEPIEPLPGLDIMADQGDEYTSVTLDMEGVVKLRRYLQRLERKAKR